MKLCWWCKHFAYEHAEPDYSEMTPGSNFDITCLKDKWDFDAYKTTQEQFGAMLVTASRCNCYERLGDKNKNE